MAREATNSGTSSLIVSSENSKSASVANNAILSKFYFSTVASSTTSEEFAVNKHCLGLSSLPWFEPSMTLLSPSGQDISTSGLFATTTYSLFASEGKTRLGLTDFFVKYSTNSSSSLSSAPDCLIPESFASSLVDAGYASSVDALPGTLFSMKVNRLQSDNSITSQVEQWRILNVILESSPDYVYFSKSLGNFIISYQPFFRYSFANISIFCFPRESPSMIRDTILKTDKALNDGTFRLLSWLDGSYQLSKKGNENLSFYLYPQSSGLFITCFSASIVFSAAQLACCWAFKKKDYLSYSNPLFLAPCLASFLLVMLVFPPIAYFGLMDVSLCTVFSIRAALMVLIEFILFVLAVVLFNALIGRNRKGKRQ